MTSSAMVNDGRALADASVEPLGAAAALLEAGDASLDVEESADALEEAELEVDEHPTRMVESPRDAVMATILSVGVMDTPYAAVR